MKAVGLSVAAALSWYFAILVNKICKIMRIFERQLGLTIEIGGAETDGGVGVLDGVDGTVGVTEGFCEGSGADLANDVGGGIDESKSCGRKVILPNTQSINGL
jgi:hypothetical protein